MSVDHNHIDTCRANTINNILRSSTSRNSTTHSSSFGTVAPLFQHKSVGVVSHINKNTSFTLHIVNTYIYMLFMFVRVAPGGKPAQEVEDS